MRLYRVHWHTGNGNSAGFSWFARRRDALAAVKKVINRDELEDSDLPEVEAFDIEVSAQGVLDAMGRYAAHADNG